MDGQAHLTRPRARTNKFFHSFSQLRGIVRLRVKDERGADQSPYPSQMDIMHSDTTTKPYISQPTFELEGGLKNNDGELSKLSGLSERLSSRHASTLQKKPIFDQDFPLCSHPRSSHSSKKSDPLPDSLKLPSHFNKSVQSPDRVDNMAITITSKVPSELPPLLMEPTNSLTFMSEKELITDINTKAQPESRLLTGRRRSSTTNSLLTTVTTKTSGSLVKLKQSFSQLQLISTFKSDVTGQLISPKSTNTHAQTSSPTVSSPPTSPSLVPVSKSPTSIVEPSLYDPPVGAAAISTPNINPTMATISNPRPYDSDRIASGALAPMSLPRHLPHPGNIHRRSPAQPPRLDIPPTNPGLSLTISPTLMTNTGPARFSPTVISRPMPLPLSNLPTLTPRSDSPKAVPSSRGTPGSSSFGFGVPVKSMSKVAGKQKVARENSRIQEGRRVGSQQLKSMPALPIQGSGRGVKGHEESDDMEEDDSVDDEDEFEDEGQSSKRFESSKPTFFTPDMNADGFRPNFEDSMRVAGHVTSSFISNASASAFQQMKRLQSDGTSSSGSSYHSVFSGVQLPPAFSGSSVGSARLLNEPLPPRARRVQYTKTSPFLSESQSADSSSRPQISPHDARLPEVDTSSFDTSFLSAPPLADPTAAAIFVDVKGKGKARDLDPSPTPGTFTPFDASATVIGGTTRADHNYDLPRTPITVTSPSTSPSTNNQYQAGSVDTFGTGALRVLNAGCVHSRGQGSSMTIAARFSTGTTQQAPLDCGVGKNQSGIDYFTAKKPNLKTDVDVMAGPATSPPPASVYSHSNPRYPSLHSSVTTTISPHLHFWNSAAFSPSPTSYSSRTSRSRADGFLGDMSKPQKNPPLMMMGLDSVGVVGGVHKHDVRSGNFGEQVFTMPQLYKRLSRSQVDLHTIETKERKRLMEAEVRAEEELELAKFRERERSSLEHKEDIAKESILVKGGSSYDKIQEDDGDDNEVVGKSDQISAAVPLKATMGHSPLIATATITNTHDSAPSAFSSTSKPTSSAATKRQNGNRLSTASHYLRRRRSMPVYDESSEPPPYPSFAPHPSSQYKIMPREDEGCECLPSYTNPIYLKAIMPRKMEFSSFGVQARDRKWRRVMCVLDGTVLRVYKCPPGYAGIGVLGEWWERQVGAGDVSSQPSHSGIVSKIQIETRESRRLAEERRDFERQVQRIMKDVGDVRESGETDDVFAPPSAMSAEGDSTRSRTGSNVSLHQNLMMSTSSSSKSRFAQFLKPGPWHHTRSKSERVNTRNVPDQPPRPSLNITNRSGPTTPQSAAVARSSSPYESTRSHTAMSNSSLNLSASNSSVTERETSSSSIYGHQHRQGQQEHKLQRQFLYSNREISFIPDPEPEDLLKEYTLQNAESGIGNDYLKRKNVIRLRMEGEQFLLQARDVTGVVEWIEALQAATNISLDLDERPMPRGPLFPRRRRRRRPLVGMNNDSSTMPSIQAETTTVLTPPFTTAIV